MSGPVQTFGGQPIIRVTTADALRSPLEDIFIDWLIDIAYPFDTVFDPPPPVDLKRLALRWKEREDWSDVSDEDAIACIEEEANCG